MTVVGFFFNDTATTEIYTLSLHDALPILQTSRIELLRLVRGGEDTYLELKVKLSNPEKIAQGICADRKSTRLNSSHANISYAVFCLKKKRLTYRDCTITYASCSF